MNNQEQLRPDVVHNRVFNNDIVKGRWKEFKGGVRQLWGQLTDDELEETKGEMTSIAGLIQRKYGESKESVEEKLDGVFKNFYDEEAEREIEEEDNFPSESPIDAANRNARERQL